MTEEETKILCVELMMQLIQRGGRTMERVIITGDGEELGRVWVVVDPVINQAIRDLFEEEVGNEPHTRN